MIRLIKSAVHKLGRSYIKATTRSEYESQRDRRMNERPIEYRFAFESIGKMCPRTVLDVGTGKSALSSLIRTCDPTVKAIDNICDYWAGELVNEHFHIVDEDVTKGVSGQFDIVLCVSVLEHIKDDDAAVKHMLTAVKPGGYLLLSFPYNEQRYVENVYQLPQAGYGKDLPYPAQVYSRQQLD